MTADEILEIEGEIARLEGEIRTLKREKQTALEQYHGVAPGDVVVCTNGKHAGQDALVRKVRFVIQSPWLRVSFRKKDGNWSKAELNIFNDWEKR